MDWSSDVCSSDVHAVPERQILPGVVRLAGCAGGGSDAAARCHYSFPALARPWRQARLSASPPDVDPVRTVDGGTGDFNVASCHPRTLVHLGCGRTRIEPDIPAGDRKSVVKGKSVSVGVDVGC